MAYNNYSYYPYYQQIPNPAQQMVNPVQQRANGVIWVQGLAAAKSYLVAPGETVQLWDSEENVIYLKSADATGMPSMKIIDYKVRENGSPNSVLSPSESNQYATKEELKELQNALEKRLNEITKGGLTNGEPVV